MNQLLCARRTLCSLQRLPGAGWSLVASIPKLFPCSQSPGILFKLATVSQTVCLVRRSTGMAFVAVIADGVQFIAINQDISWRDDSLCMFCFITALCTSWPIGRGYDFNDHCQWPGTCVSEAFPPRATLLGRAGGCSRAREGASSSWGGGLEAAARYLCALDPERASQWHGIQNLSAFWPRPSERLLLYKCFA